jgi:hypothetical protein
MIMKKIEKKIMLGCISTSYDLSHKLCEIHPKKVWRYQSGNQKRQIEEGQTAQWPRINVPREK